MSRLGWTHSVQTGHGLTSTTHRDATRVSLPCSMMILLKPAQPPEPLQQKLT